MTRLQITAEVCSGKRGKFEKYFMPIRNQSYNESCLSFYLNVHRLISHSG